MKLIDIVYVERPKAIFKVEMYRDEERKSTIQVHTIASEPVKAAPNN